MGVAKEEPVIVENEEEQKLLDARNPYDGTVYLDGKRYFWDQIANGRKVEVGGVNTGQWIRVRDAGVPVAMQESVDVEN